MNFSSIREMTSGYARVERISAHSHVRGLGLDPQTLLPRGPSSEGLVSCSFDFVCGG